MLTTRRSLCLISVLRTVWLGQLLYSPDMTWDYTAIANWTSTELNVAVVCGCMPTLKPVLTKMFGPLMDRFFPSEHQSLEDSSPANTRPRTVGSMPMRAFRFRRQPKNQNSSRIRTLSESSWADRGTLATTAVETNGGEFRRGDVDPEAGLNVDGETPVIALSQRPGKPPRAYVKD